MRTLAKEQDVRGARPDVHTVVFAISPPAFGRLVSLTATGACTPGAGRTHVFRWQSDAVQHNPSTVASSSQLHFREATGRKSANTIAY